jgi:hypothetical protein
LYSPLSFYFLVINVLLSQSLSKFKVSEKENQRAITGVRGVG